MKKLKLVQEQKVSVIIPFFNRIPFTVESVKSVIAQTHENWELLLVDDGSTDDLSALQALIEEDKRIRLLTSSHLGAAAARNHGIREASGDYIAFLDSDDLWLKDKLKYQLADMLLHNNDVSHTSYQHIKPDGTPLEIVHSSQQSGKVYPSILSSCVIATPTVMIRSSILKKMQNPFPVDFHIGEDVCLWIDLSYQFEFGGVDMSLTLVRVSDNSAASNYETLEIGLSNTHKYILASDVYRYESEQIIKLWESLCFVRQQNKSLVAEEPPLPLVSIIIPVYNGSKYIREAIDSALSQTYPNVEVLVVNDGSADNGETERIALEYGDRIRYFHKDNGGVATALNLGIKEMKGEYFAWLSHDDIYLPNKIEREVAELQSSGKKNTIICGGYQVISEKGDYLGSVNLKKLYSRKQLREPLFALLHGGINGCAVLIHRSHFERVGLFDPDLPSTQDYDLWFRMFRFQTVRYYDGANVLSRNHNEQNSKKMPSHIEDCNALWIGMLMSTSKDEQIRLAGSSAAFFNDIASFLSSASNYQEAVSYACQRAATYRQKRLCQTYSWRITKPIRAFQYARKSAGSIASKVRHYCMYRISVTLDQKFDAEILRSRCWKLTTPFRNVAGIIRRFNQKTARIPMAERRIRSDTGLILSDPYAYKCCEIAGIKSEFKHDRYKKPSEP